jgi:manganese-dependent inorganic pyrophosphatase
MLKVFGHKSPDTDSVLSAIVYAWYSNTINHKEATAYVNGDLNNESKFVLDHFQVAYPEKLAQLAAGDEVVIVDTNNPEELPGNISEAKIVEIVDHHKLSGLATAGPISMILKPVASTTSIIFSTLLQGKTEGVDSNILGLILAGIISDTLEFRSPTTTPVDKQNAEMIAAALQINITELANQMFAAKSDISQYSAKELLLLDSKVFNIKGQNIRIAALETTDPMASVNQKSQLKIEMQAIKQAENLGEVLFFAIDILKEEAHLIVASESAKAMCEAAFGVTIADDSVILPGVISRKKQIIPALEK